MKTKIRTLITVCLLAFVGVLNANATVNFEEKSVVLSNGNESFSALNEKLASFAADQNGTVDYQKEAQLITRLIADMAEAKVTLQVIEKNTTLTGDVSNPFETEIADASNDEITDFRKEAQFVTKAIADKEEAHAIQKLVTEGKIADNR